MAKAEKVPVDDFNIKLTLSLEEASFVYGILGRSSSQYASSVYVALGLLKLGFPNRTFIMSNNTIIEVSKG